MRRIPSHNFFSSLHQRLAVIDSFQRTGGDRVRIARTPTIEQNVLKQVHVRVHEVKCAQLGFPRDFGGFSENTTCIGFTCGVSRHYKLMIMHLLLLFHSGTLESVLQIAFSLIKCCFPMMHSSQGKDF